MDSKEIAAELDHPLSTVQRRIRRIQESGILTFKPQLNYQALGLKKGLLHVYMKQGDLQMIAEKLAQLDGVLSASIHIGNSDILVEFLFEESREILGLIARAKRISSVERVVWSQEILTFSKPLQLSRREQS